MVISYWRKYVHEVVVNRLRGLSLPRKSVVRLNDRPDMTLDVYRGRKTTIQQQQQLFLGIPRLDTAAARIALLSRVISPNFTGKNRARSEKRNKTHSLVCYKKSGKIIHEALCFSILMIVVQCL